MNNLGFEIQPSTDKNPPFIVRSTHPTKPPPYKFYCVGLTEEQGREWREQFEIILEGQKSFMRALSMPIAYQNDLKKSASLEEKDKKMNNECKSDESKHKDGDK